MTDLTLISGLSATTSPILVYGASRIKASTADPGQKKFKNTIY